MIVGHRWIGLWPSIVLVILGLTGAILVYEHDLPPVLHPHLWRVAPTGERISIEAALEAASASHPGRIFSSVKIFTDPAPPYIIRTNDRHLIFVNPYTGSIMGEHNSESSFFSVMRKLHVDLMMGSAGGHIVGIGTILLVVLTLTGLYLWWVRRSALRRRSYLLTFKTDWKQFNYDTHNVLGFYSSVFVLLISLTGIVLAYPWAKHAIYYAIDGRPAPKFVPPQSHPATDGVKRISPDQALASARAIAPARYHTAVRLPQSPQDCIAVYHDHGAGNGDNIFIDAYTGKTLRVDRYADRSTAQKIHYSMFPIHAGYILGEPTKFIAFVSSPLVAVLGVTGFVIWLPKYSCRNS